MDPVPNEAPAAALPAGQYNSDPNASDEDRNGTPPECQSEWELEINSIPPHSETSTRASSPRGLPSERRPSTPLSRTPSPFLPRVPPLSPHLGHGPGMPALLADTHLSGRPPASVPGTPTRASTPPTATVPAPPSSPTIRISFKRPAAPPPRPSRKARKSPSPRRGKPKKKSNTQPDAKPNPGNPHQQQPPEPPSWAGWNHHTPPTPTNITREPEPEYIVSTPDVITPDNPTERLQGGTSPSDELYIDEDDPDEIYGTSDEDALDNDDIAVLGHFHPCDPNNKGGPSDETPTDPDPLAGNQTTAMGLGTAADLGNIAKAVQIAQSQAAARPAGPALATRTPARCPHCDIPVLNEGSHYCLPHASPPPEPGQIKPGTTGIQHKSVTFGLATTEPTRAQYRRLLLETRSPQAPDPITAVVVASHESDTDGPQHEVTGIADHPERAPIEATIEAVIATSLATISAPPALSPPRPTCNPGTSSPQAQAIIQPGHRAQTTTPPTPDQPASTEAANILQQQVFGTLGTLGWVPPGQVPATPSMKAARNKLQAYCSLRPWNCSNTVESGTEASPHGELIHAHRLSHWGYNEATFPVLRRLARATLSRFPPTLPPHLGREFPLDYNPGRTFPFRDVDSFLIHQLVHIGGNSMIRTTAPDTLHSFPLETSRDEDLARHLASWVSMDNRIDAFCTRHTSDKVARFAPPGFIHDYRMAVFTIAKIAEIRNSDRQRVTLEVLAEANNRLSGPKQGPPLTLPEPGRKIGQIPPTQAQITAATTQYPTLTANLIRELYLPSPLALETTPKVINGWGENNPHIATFLDCDHYARYNAAINGQPRPLGSADITGFQVSIQETFVQHYAGPLLERYVELGDGVPSPTIAGAFCEDSILLRNWLASQLPILGVKARRTWSRYMDFSFHTSCRVLRDVQHSECSVPLHPNTLLGQALAIHEPSPGRRVILPINIDIQVSEASDTRDGSRGQDIQQFVSHDLLDAHQNAETDLATLVTGIRLKRIPVGTALGQLKQLSVHRRNPDLNPWAIVDHNRINEIHGSIATRGDPTPQGSVSGPKIPRLAESICDAGLIARRAAPPLIRRPLIFPYPQPVAPKPDTPTLSEIPLPAIVRLNRMWQYDEGYITHQLRTIFPPRSPGGPRPGDQPPIHPGVLFSARSELQIAEAMAQQLAQAFAQRRNPPPSRPKRGFRPNASMSPEACAYNEETTRRGIDAFDSAVRRDHCRAKFAYLQALATHVNRSTMPPPDLLQVQTAEQIKTAILDKRTHPRNYPGHQYVPDSRKKK